jgi:HPt (histidine-containing phosphotransfer) domain-containing protein
MVDWMRVKDLQDEIGADDFAEVVQLFLEETDAVVDRLAASPPLTEIEALLHFLKGSSVNLGLATLGRLCAEGERRAAAGQPQDVDLAAVAQTYARSKHEFLTGLQDRRVA